jgi:hypothetical protein
VAKKLLVRYLDLAVVVFAVNFFDDLLGLFAVAAEDGELVLALFAVPDGVFSAEIHGDADFAGVGGDFDGGHRFPSDFHRGQQFVARNVEMARDGSKDRSERTDLHGAMKGNSDMMFAIPLRRHVHVVSALANRIVADPPEPVNDLVPR